MAFWDWIEKIAAKQYRAGKNALPIEVTGSTLQDSQALPMTQAQKDIVAMAIDNIIDTIGAENIKLFLPMWETEGTKAYDLLNRDLTFTINGATLGASGPFGRCMSFDGVNDCLIQDPVTENTAGNTDLALNSATMKAATRMVAIATTPGFVVLKLKRVGTLSTATVRVVIYTDNAGVPGTAVTNGTSNTLACSTIGTSYENRGFVFSAPPSLQNNQKYWLVLEYVDGTGVDASNYIAWQYESGANTYGEQRAVYNGTSWTATAGENHVFCLWSNALALPYSYSFIVCAKNNATIPSNRQILCGTTETSSYRLGLLYISSGSINYITAQGNNYLGTPLYAWPLSFNVFAATFSYESSTEKHKSYYNGSLIGSANGSADTSTSLFGQPFLIGAGITPNGVLGSFFYGSIGPVIITSSVLTPAQVAKVSHYLLAVRKYGLGV